MKIEKQNLLNEKYKSGLYYILTRKRKRNVEIKYVHVKYIFKTVVSFILLKYIMLQKLCTYIDSL